MNEPVVVYGLEGFDDELRTAGRSELPSIIYTNLRGRTYTFRFGLVDPATGETGKQISLVIVKKKGLHERIWFWLFVQAAVYALIVVGVRLYLRKKNREMALEKEQDRIRTELSVARDIQASMLPRVFPAFPERTEFDLYASMDPAKEVAGDFYDFYLIDEDHLALIIADVSGKGVGAALFMVAAKNALKNTIMSRRFTGPGKILEDVNNQLCEDNEAEMFVTVWLGILTISTGELVTANGGHEYPVFFRSGKEPAMMRSKHGPGLGVMEGISYREENWLLAAGEGVFVYTDGVTEAADRQEKLFGNQRLLQALKTLADKSPKEILEGVHAAVDAFVGDAPQFDDLTMLSMKYLGSTQKNQTERQQ